MVLNLIFLIFTNLIIPISFLMWIWRAKFKCKLDWILLVLMAGAYIILIFYIGSWSWFSYYLRYVVFLGYLSGVFFSLWKVRHQPFNRKREQGEWFPVVIPSLATIMFAAMFLFTVAGFTYSGDSVFLEFPLHKGTFTVIQGGDSPFINHHHHPESPLKYSLDITKLNTIGNRCYGFYPKNINNYAIYGEPVYSPCDGMVKIAVEGIDNSKIAEPDTTNFRGNYITINFGEINIVLAHLKPGSLLVREGDSVRQGEKIAEVGNSGFSSEPHLHIHAEIQDAEAFMGSRPVAILFNGNFYKRNDLIYR